MRLAVGARLDIPGLDGDFAALILDSQGAANDPSVSLHLTDELTDEQARGLWIDIMAENADGEIEALTIRGPDFPSNEVGGTHVEGAGARSAFGQQLWGGGTYHKYTFSPPDTVDVAAFVECENE